MRYATTLREVTPAEQHVHSFLELVPLMAFALSIVSHPAQFGALFGFGNTLPDLNLRMKREKLPKAYVIGVLAGIAVFNALPYFEEFWRGIRVRTKRRAHSALA